MVKVLDQADVSNRIGMLKKIHESRLSRQRAVLALSRGLDPRTVVWQNMLWSELSLKTGTQDEALRTNDPRTYLDIGTHLLSGRPLDWVMPRFSNIAEDIEEKHGMAERVIQSYFRINNKRLSNKQRPRFERIIADSALRFGMIAVYYTKADMNGDDVYVMEPWDPMSIAEKSDDWGLSEITRRYQTNIYDLEELADKEDGWDIREIARRIRDKEEDFEVAEYYVRTRDVVRHTVVTNEGEFKSLRNLTELDIDEIPVKIGSANGEAFPAEEFWRGAQSILEPNFNQYLLHHDNLKRIEKHRDQTIAFKVQENTLGGRPGPATPTDIADSTEVKVFPYRVTEGFDIKPIPQFDRSMDILAAEFPGQIQRGGLPYIFTGNIDTNLSGFAIFQLLNSALASVNETKVVLEGIYSSLGKWILDDLKGGGVSGKIKVLSSTGEAREQFQFDEISARELPVITDIQAKINLAQPSDLIERINIMRTAMPGSGALISLRTGYDEILPDIVSDSGGEAQAVMDERIMQLPVMQMLKARKGLVEFREEMRAIGNQFSVEATQQQIDLLEQQITGNGNGTNPQTNVATGNNATPDNRVSSSPTRNGAGR